jgi:anaerobic nitric oxide reductase flavorubredoxin
MSILVKNNIHWVGQRDWEVRDFHGTEYKTLRGSSYNSYLIREGKNVLIDTVDHKFSREFVQNLRSEIDLDAIDYIVINHAEEDHAGALTELMSYIPNTPIYCTTNAIDSINGHHHHPEWNFHTVKTGDSLDIGNGKQLIFVETPMLHWPDSMMTYMTGDAVLFSNDAFGQHYCDERLFNDEVDQAELFEQCQRYYANILTPFSRLVTPKITEILGFNLPVDMIATSHGVVWRENPTQIVELYLKWAADYQEDRITIFYDTMSNNTRMMADAIAQGINEVDPNVAVKIFNVARSDKNDILTNVFRSKGVLVGTSTMNNVMMPKIAGLVEEMTGLRFRNKRASAFGSHGWSGGAVDRLSTRLQDAGFEMSMSLKAKWRPDIDALEICRQHGREIARQWALAPLPDATVKTPNSRKPAPVRLPRRRISARGCSAAFASGFTTRNWANRCRTSHQGHRGAMYRTTSCALNVHWVKTSLTNWVRRQNEQRDRDHRLGLCRPPAGEKYPQTGHERAADAYRCRQHGRVQQAGFKPCH